MSHIRKHRKKRTIVTNVVNCLYYFEDKSTGVSMSLKTFIS